MQDFRSWKTQIHVLAFSKYIDLNLMHTEMNTNSKVGVKTVGNEK